MGTFLPYSTHASDIVGYSFNADIYCPDHIVAQVTSNPGDVNHATAAIGNAEAHLDLCARIKGIDRYDEGSYDGGDFPKVIHASDATSDDRCGVCGEQLTP